MSSNQRRFRIVRPRLQLRLIFSFLGIAVLALLLQYVLFARMVVETARTLPNDSAILVSSLATDLAVVLLLSVLVLLPITLLIGVLITHRIAGPITRLERYLKEVLAGKEREACRLRKGDELQEMCELVNQATLPLRERQGSAGPSRDAA